MERRELGKQSHQVVSGQEVLIMDGDMPADPAP